MKIHNYIIAIVICFCIASQLSKAQDKDFMSIAICGDIMMGTTYPKTCLPKNKGKDLFKDVAPILQAADLAVGNLEGTLCNDGQSTKGSGKYSFAFRTPTSYAPLLSEAGFDYLSMANNHCRDFGMHGILSTEQCLDEQEIAYSGVAGRKEWAIVERNGIKYGICAFGHNSYTIRHNKGYHKVKEILDTLKSMTDIIIVSFHGGAEGLKYTHLPRGREVFLGEDRGNLREFAHFCIDNGADLVYGHGPHVVRCVEVYKGHFIAYSLGNFCTPYGMNLGDVRSYSPVITVRINRYGEFIDAQIHPNIQKPGIGPRADKSGKVIRNIMSLTKSDVPESQTEISEDGQIYYKEKFRRYRYTIDDLDKKSPIHRPAEKCKPDTIIRR